MLKGASKSRGSILFFLGKGRLDAKGCRVNNTGNRRMEKDKRKSFSSSTIN
ncbi:MAG: hypothetical protein AB7S48_02625 [Bacteroidales bacterium]